MCRSNLKKETVKQNWPHQKKTAIFYYHQISLSLVILLPPFAVHVGRNTFHLITLYVAYGYNADLVLFYPVNEAKLLSSSSLTFGSHRQASAASALDQ